MDSIPKITLGYTYYNEPELLKKQIRLWKKYPTNVEIFLVDDGSEIYPAYDLVKRLRLPNFQLYRVTGDIGFNSHGCRNLIATVASSSNIMFLDIDAHLAVKDAFSISEMEVKDNFVYKMAMSVGRKQYSFPGHHNIFVINKDTFWRSGGYDESFTGYHKGDREFLSRLDRISKCVEIPDVVIKLIRGGRESIVDTSVKITTYDDKNMILRIPKRTPSDKELKGKVNGNLNFHYQKIL